MDSTPSPGLALTTQVFVGGRKARLSRLKGLTPSLAPRGGAAAREEAVAIYELITDPINHALVERDAGIEALNLGNRDEARRRFEQSRDIAKRCGSWATELKALVGLAACGETLDRGDLERLRREITGWGFRRYIDRLLM